MAIKVGEEERSRAGKEPETSLILREVSSRVWSSLRSRNLAIVVMALVAVLIIVALTLPQPDQLGPRVYANWRQANPALAQLVEALGLDHLFSTWWFLTIAALLYLNTLACTTTQVRAATKTMLAQPAFPSPRFLQDGKHSVQMEFAASAAKVIGGAGPVLERHGYNVKPLEGREARAAPSSTLLYAEKGRLGVAGSPILHVGLLVVFTAVGWSGLTRFAGYVELGEGQSFKDAKGAYIQSSEGPLSLGSHNGFTLRVDRIEEEKPVVVGRAVDLNARSEVTILDGDAEAITGTLEVNRSLAFRGVRLYQTRLFGPGVVFLLEYPDGKVDQGMINLTVADGTVYKNGLYLPRTIYYADVAVDASDDSVNVDVRYRDQNLFSGQMKPGQKLKFGDGVMLTLVDVRRWTGLRVVSDPSEPLLYLGFLITVIGLAICALVIRQQIWVVVEDRGAKSRLLCAGTTAKNRAMFAEEFDEISKDFRKLAQ